MKTAQVEKKVIINPPKVEPVKMPPLNFNQ